MSVGNKSHSGQHVSVEDNGLNDQPDEAWAHSIAAGGHPVLLNLSSEDQLGIEHANTVLEDRQDLTDVTDDPSVRVSVCFLHFSHHLFVLSLLSVLGLKSVFIVLFRRLAILLGKVRDD